jgi:hypothetical protein
LKIDFNQAGGAVEAGYQGYFATDKSAASFTAQSYSAFDATVTIQPTWAAGANAACLRMIDRGVTDVIEAPSLMRDWIGTDTRQPGDPMTLTITGLPAGTYQWVSYHHDRNDQTGIFQVTINDAMGSKTIADIDISNGTNFKLADVTKLTATIVSSGQGSVTLVFDQTSASSVVANAIFVMNAFDLTMIETGNAMSPSPASQATDVPRDGTMLSWAANSEAVSHDVYFGTDAKVVEEATTGDAIYRGRQDAAQFIPGRLGFGQTYYWRIDEVQAGGTVVKGHVWSFTVEPFSVVLAGANITATAASMNSATEGPEKTIDGSGLDAGGLHGVDSTTMWLSAAAASDPVWIQYEFDKLYQLHEMLIWNYNTTSEAFVGFGSKDVTIDYSGDGATWTTLGGSREIASGTSSAGYAANTTIDFAGTAAKYVRINVASNWGGIIKRYGLSEVRFLVIPVSAREPQPAVNAAGVDPRSVLSWRAGRSAAKHQVYLSTDVNEVTSGKALVGTVSEPQFDAAGVLALGKTYYWKVNEVNDLDAQTVWEGDVWSFSTTAFLPVEDMESYTDDEGTRIYETWVDGWGTQNNGSQVGNTEAPFAEATIVHGGRQAMPLKYDNSATVYSEATRAFETPQDWTQFGVQGLVLWFYGNPTNTAGQMYVKVNGKKVAYDGDAENTLRKPWQMWYIDLGGFTGVNLKKVTELTIGLEGGQGIVLIDDIGLSPLTRQLVTPAQPAATGLVAQYAFEGNANDSKGKLNGVVTGAPTYVEGKAGQAIKLDGARDFVLVESAFELPVYTAALWFRVDGGTGQRDILSIYDSAGAHGVLLEITADGTLRSLHRAPIGAQGGTEANSGFLYADAAWHHAALVKSEASVTLYINGVSVNSVANPTALDHALQRMTLGVLKHDNLTRYFPGAIDEVSLYNRVLSDAEIASLAGRIKPFDKP